MSPAVIYAPSDVPIAAVKFTPSEGPSLVIGSPATALNGKYQSLVVSLGENNVVERQMLDRLTDGAATLTPATYSSIHVVLSGTDYETLVPRLPDLLSQILSALSPLGKLYLHSLPPGLKSLPSDLTVAGFVILSNLTEGTIIAQSPAHSPGTSFSLKNRAAAVALPRRAADQERKLSKKALWMLKSPSTPTIDAESLLTAADRERPARICAPANSVGRRRKCKGCTCELAELEDEEPSKVVVLDGGEGGAAVEVAVSEMEKLLIAAKNSSKATSSCGSCYLGDAFRCASCPYMGLPSFRPGEKVEIDFGMDDI